jgi:hypothetical protein
LLFAFFKKNGWNSCLLGTKGNVGMVEEGQLEGPKNNQPKSLFSMGLSMSQLPEKFLFLSQLKKCNRSLKKGATATSCTFLTEKCNCTFLREKHKLMHIFRVTEK